MASDRHLKIGFVLDGGLEQPDGVQQYILALGEWLRAGGHDVHYLVGETHRPDLINVHSLSRSVSVRFNGNAVSIPLPSSQKRLTAFMKEQQFDVLHVQTPYSPFMGHKLMKAADSRVAVIGTYHIAPHSWIVTAGTKLLGLWLHKTIKRFDTVVSVSTEAQRFAKITFGLDTEVLPNVFDYERFHAAKPLVAYDDDVQTILFFGRLVPRKGCGLLLQAAALLKKDTSVPPFRIVICGRGALLPKLEAYAAENDLSENVTFEGFIDEADKPSFYASADISVFPASGGESFGIVLLEAMASGKAAVLAGDNPGYRSVLHPREHLLFDPHNASLLAEKLKKLLLDEATRKQEAAWGAAYTKQYDTPVVGAAIVDIYRQALRRRQE